MNEFPYRDLPYLKSNEAPEIFTTFINEELEFGFNKKDFRLAELILRISIENGIFPNLQLILQIKSIELRSLLFSNIALITYEYKTDKESFFKKIRILHATVKDITDIIFNKDSLDVKDLYNAYIHEIERGYEDDGSFIENIIKMVEVVLRKYKPQFDTFWIGDDLELLEIEYYSFLERINSEIRSYIEFKMKNTVEKENIEILIYKVVVEGRYSLNNHLDKSLKKMFDLLKIKLVNIKQSENTTLKAYPALTNILIDNYLIILDRYFSDFFCEVKQNIKDPKGIGRFNFVVRETKDLIRRSLIGKSSYDLPLISEQLIN